VRALRATPAAKAGLTRSPGRVALVVILARFGRLHWRASVGSTEASDGRLARFGLIDECRKLKAQPIIWL
jgi:hypothetical protein